MKKSICLGVVVLFLVTFISGCAFTNNLMAKWIGHPIEDVVYKWGAPTSRIYNSNGTETFTWGFDTSTKEIKSVCRKSFTVNSYQKIIGYSTFGCFFLDAKEANSP
jgi:hypothetical protein